jgi:hypothetical protein
MEDLWYYTNRLIVTIKYIPYELYYGFKNFWTFKRDIWRFRNFDYSYSLLLFKRGLQEVSKDMHTHEYAQFTKEQLRSIRIVIECIDRITNESDYTYISHKDYEELFNLIPTEDGKYFTFDNSKDKKLRRKHLHELSMAQEKQYMELFLIEIKRHMKSWWT